MPAATRITNESVQSQRPIIVKLFCMPPVVDGEHGLAKIVDKHILECGQSMAFTLDERHYFSVEPYFPPTPTPHYIP